MSDSESRSPVQIEALQTRTFVGRDFHIHFSGSELHARLEELLPLLKSPKVQVHNGRVTHDGRSLAVPEAELQALLAYLMALAPVEPVQWMERYLGQVSLRWLQTATASAKIEEIDTKVVS